MSCGSDFWSRRKARVEAEEAEEARRIEAAEVEATQAQLEERPTRKFSEFGRPIRIILNPVRTLPGS